MGLRTFKQNTLWREKMISYLEQAGSIIHSKQLDDKNFSKQLKLKLQEEALEAAQAQSAKELIGELADILEVVTALCRLHGFSIEEAINAQQKKYKERGGFSNNTFVTTAQHPKGSLGEKYCLNNPQKYPEVTD